MDMRLLGGSHLLRALGFNPGGFFDHLEEFHARQFDMLSNLQDSFGLCSGNMGANALAQMLQGGGIAPSGCAAQPDSSCCRCPGQYSEPQSFDFGATPGGSNPFSFEALSNRMQGMQFERFLQNNPFARQQVEMMLGGRIIPDGVADGRVQVQRFPGGGQGGSPSAQNAMGFLDQIMRAGMASGLPMPQMFQGMMMAALTNLLQGGGAGGANGIRSQGGGSPFVDWADSPQARRNQQIAGGGGGGGPGGPHQATQGGPTQGAFGIGNGDDGDASSVLNDSSLTVEDKVTLMIMMIMKKMDKDIEKQANYINKLQQQQQGGGGGKGGKGGGGGGGNPSIDVETMKLKRLIDKRSQMFDMLRQIIDKYNETAKNIIQSMGR